MHNPDSHDEEAIRHELLAQIKDKAIRLVLNSETPENIRQHMKRIITEIDLQPAIERKKPRF